MPDLNDGYLLIDDFLDTELIPTVTTQAGIGKYKAFATSTNGTLAASNGLCSATLEGLGGALSFSSTTGASEVALGTAMLPFQISAIPNTSSAINQTDSLWFEARIAFSALPYSGVCDLFVGLLGQDTYAAGHPVATAGTLVSTLDAVGFMFPSTTASAVKTMYQAASVTPVTVQTLTAVPSPGLQLTYNSTTSPLSGAPQTAALAVNTWYRLGMWYDRAAATLKYFIEGVPMTTYLTSSVLAAASETAFPNGAALGPCIAMLGTSNACTVYLDWWACGQIRPAQYQ
jgi:hypothetical protein